ncbi:MAG TPA: thioredoxin domain-containing protein [Labilithrix sp.]|nr:thioredoxin domain-containing protein [Labilithrix sp.]
MRKPLPFWAVIAICAAALAASAVLLVDYVRPAAVFCDAEGGCGVVRRTIFAYPLGIPTPLFGIAGFLSIGLAQLLPGRRARIAQAMLASFGAIVALGLLAVQASMKTLCPFCAVADVSALLLVGLSVLRALRGWDPPAPRLQLAGGVLAICAAVGVPLVVGMNKKAIPATLPPVIADELRATPRDRVTVVDFVDFECPFCRMTHAHLGPLLEARKDKVRVVRKHVPLRMHAHAMDAAKAACCGERLGKGPEMTEALFTVPPEELTPEGCEALAAKHGLDAAAFRDCVKDPAIEARIKGDADTFRAAHGHGLPTIFIGDTKLEGSQERAVLEATLDGAIRAL